MNDDAAYLALRAHDARFDGRLFVGVTSTGIYCRPVCRVRTPRRENCRFYANAAQAEQAGFRPCLRCRPELAPGLAWVDSPQVLAAQAMRMLDAAVARGEACPMTSLAARLGVSDRHLRRIFHEAHGVGPVDHLVTRRLLMAKALLTDTQLPITEVAHASGFGSLRRFHAAFAAHYRMNPTQLRASRSRAPAPSTRQAAAAGLPGAIVLRLPYRPPYDVAGTLVFYRRRALAGIEVMAPTDEASPWLRRTLHIATTSGGQIDGWLEARFEPGRDAVTLHLAPALAPVLGAVLARVRHALDLDAEPGLIDPVLATLPGMSCMSVMSVTPGLRVPGAFDSFETVVRIVLGQQVSVAAARTLTQRVVERFGHDIATPWPGVHRGFPAPATVAGAAPAALGELGIVRQRVQALQALARAIAEGTLRLEAGDPVPATLTQLTALPGIGPWTAQMIALRVLAWPDAYPASDIGVQRALGVASAAAAQAAAEAWRPWRSYAVMALWQRLESPGRRAEEASGLPAPRRPTEPPDTDARLTPAARMTRPRASPPTKDLA